MQNDGKGTNDWKPLEQSERYATLDLVRGLSLFGVLLINLMYFFRVSLFQHIFVFHSHPGRVNHAIDLLLAALVEFKAFDLFSLTFGIGVAVQAERAKLRGAGVELFLIRRFLILLAVGALHMVFVSNVDILMLYAACGLILIPLLRLPATVMAVAGVAAVYLPTMLSRWTSMPDSSILQAHAAEATRMYREGSFGALVEFRWRETQQMIAPLLFSVAQKTLGLMLVGAAIWRSRVVRDPRPYRRLLWGICGVAGTVGLFNTTSGILQEHFGKPLAVSPYVDWLGSHVPLAIAYGAALLAYRRSERPGRWTAAVMAAGQMALTNYLTQSLLFAVLFYGFGLGLFGRLDPQTALALGTAVYAAQVWFSKWWLERYRFGPFEWVWRSLTYGRRQPLLRLAASMQQSSAR